MNMNEREIPIIIDGPNFINRVLDMKIDKCLISKQLTLNGLRNVLNNFLEEEDLSGRCSSIEFVCSKKLFGSGRSKFTQAERDALLHRFMNERLVHVEEVVLPGASEKGVDNMVTTKIETLSQRYKSIILISEDRDFVPLLKKMREKETQIIVISLKEPYPIELINEAHMRFHISTNYHYQYLFEYSYPSFYVQDNFTIESFRELISNADDRQLNQIRIDNDDRIYISHQATGSQEMLYVKFRYETFAAYNGYVGPIAASDKDYVERLFDEIMSYWEADLPFSPYR